MWVIYRYYVQADDQWQHFFQFLRTTQQVLHFLDNWERDYKFLSSTYILPKGSIERREVMLFIEKWLGFTENWTICNFTKKWAFFKKYHFFFSLFSNKFFGNKFHDFVLVSYFKMRKWLLEIWSWSASFLDILDIHQIYEYPCQFSREVCYFSTFCNSLDSAHSTHRDYFGNIMWSKWLQV